MIQKPPSGGARIRISGETSWDVTQANVDLCNAMIAEKEAALDRIAEIRPDLTYLDKLKEDPYLMASPGDGERPAAYLQMRRGPDCDMYPFFQYLNPDIFDDPNAEHPVLIFKSPEKGGSFPKVFAAMKALHDVLVQEQDRGTHSIVMHVPNGLPDCVKSWPVQFDHYQKHYLPAQRA